MLTILIAVAFLAQPPQPEPDNGPACQVQVWDGNPPYDCHAPADDIDDA